MRLRYNNDNEVIGIMFSENEEIDWIDLVKTKKLNEKFKSRNKF